MKEKCKNLLNSKFSKVGLFGTVGSVIFACPVLASEGSGFIQASWVADLLPNVTADVNTMMPIGIGIMSLFLGISVVRRIVYSFI